MKVFLLTALLLENNGVSILLEIEIKAYCNNHKEIIERILSMGGERIETVKEKDIYFNHPCRDFRITDEAFRIRIRDSNSYITYKGPRMGGMTKTRYEEEVIVSDFDSMNNILLELGFTHVDNVSKERIIYNLQGIEICVDKVEDVGDFVELEKRDMDRKSAEKELFSLAESLGLSRFENRSYLELKIENKKKS